MINSILSNMNTPKPEVGMGATELYFSDRRPVTIVSVSPSGKTVYATADNYKWVGNVVEYSTNELAIPEAYTLRKNGKYVRAGQDMKDGTSLLVGKKDYYYDMEF